jgi:hypothetical protein
MKVKGLNVKYLKLVRKRFSFFYENGQVRILDHEEKRVTKLAPIRVAVEWLVLMTHGMGSNLNRIKRNKARQERVAYFETLKQMNG